MADSQQIENLVREYQRWHQEMEPKEYSQTISVDTVAALVASFYEKIRKVVDWREEHLLRKTAIERMLRRRLLLRKDGQEVGEPLVQELIRGGHLPNNTIPVDKIDDVQRIISKYAFLNLAQRQRNGALEGMADWLLGIEASEIEEVFSLPWKEKALIEFMTRELEPKFRLRKRDAGLISDTEKKYQVYVAVQKALFKLDNPTISYHIFEKLYADWANPSRETLENITGNLDQIREVFERIFNHPLAEKFYRIAENNDAPYLILHDLIDAHPNDFFELIANSSKLEEEIAQAYKERLKRLDGKIRRAALYSILSIFATKILIALFVEVPIDRYLGHEITLKTLGVNVFVPPLLMLLFISTAQTSSKENFQRALLEVIRLAHGTEKKGFLEISAPRKKKSLFTLTVYLMYAVSFVITFGAIIWILSNLHFSIPSIVVFLFFASLIAFAGTRIRQRAKELMMGETRDSLLDGIFDFFAIPVVQVGKWLSGKLARYNIVVLVLNFLVEIPFQIFVEFIEQWRAFLKEKKEEIH